MSFTKAVILVIFQIGIITIILLEKQSWYKFLCFLHLILGIVLFFYLLILEINETINFEEIRPKEFYENNIDLIIIILNVSACISRFISNGFFFLLIHYNSKIEQYQSQIIMKNTITVMFPSELNKNYINSNRKRSIEHVFENIGVQNNRNSSTFDDMNLEERLNINNIYDDEDGTESENKTVNMIRYDSAFLKIDMKKNNKVFSDKK